MARRKRKTAAPRRRRRMSGVGSSSMMDMVYATAGAVGGALAKKVLPATMDEKLRAIIPIAAGFFLPKFVSGKTGQMLGIGMVAGGGLSLVQSFGLIAGLGETPMLGAYTNAYQLNGVSDMPMVGSANPVTGNTEFATMLMNMDA